MLMVSTLTFLISCGGDNASSEKKSFSVKPLKTEVEGSLKDYIEIIDGSYEGNPPDVNQCYLKVKVKVLKKWNEYDKSKTDGIDDYSVDLKLDVLDSTGMPVSGFNEYTVSNNKDNDNDGLFNALKIGSGEVIVSFLSYMDFSEQLAEAYKKAKKFTITANMKQYRYKGSGDESTSNASNSQSTESSSSDCDQFIKDYEQFVDSYIKILKKYKKNPSDASIIAEYSDVVQKAAEMQTNASNCTDAKYTAKLANIATKMAKAAAELQ